MFLDGLTPSYKKSHFEIGINGYLGISDTFVSHKGRFYPNAIGAHAPSIVEYNLDGSYDIFESEVAINDLEEEDAESNPVDFLVYADDKLVAFVPRVRANENSRSIHAYIGGAKKLRLETNVVYYGYNNWCQSVWLSPQIHSGKDTKLASNLRDIEISIPQTIESVQKCLITTVLPNEIDKLERMLKSFFLYNKNDIKVVVFHFGESKLYKDITDKYDSILVRCNMIDETARPIKSLIAELLIGNIIHAEQYLFLSIDALVCDNISPLFDILDNLNDEKVLLCNNCWTNIVGYSLKDIISFPKSIYGGNSHDWEFLKLDGIQQYYQLIADSNVFILKKKALLGIIHFVNEMMPNILQWRNANFALSSLREQAIFNCAIAKISMGVELDSIYNHQVNNNNIDDLKIHYDSECPVIEDIINKKRIKILQINDLVSDIYPELIEYYEGK
jgi:hypothetical protein